MNKSLGILLKEKFKDRYRVINNFEQNVVRIKLGDAEVTVAAMAVDNTVFTTDEALGRWFLAEFPNLTEKNIYLCTYEELNA